VTFFITTKKNSLLRVQQELGALLLGMCCLTLLMLSSTNRNEFKAWTDIKPVKPIKAKPQYKPPDDKMAHETSYSAQFKGEANKPTTADNKVIDRRRIRSLYSEPFKEPPKVRRISWGSPQHSLHWKSCLPQR
jgi:rare lipoprotein A (peptidoglycan hydrolase)